jgi:uncharacterized protein (DUF1684 family)
MKKLSFILLSILFYVSCGPKVDEMYRRQLAAYRIKENDEFLNPLTSPLDSVELLSFKGLRFFPVDEAYRVMAKIERYNNQDTFALPHSNERTKTYRKFGKLLFSLKGQNHELIILESAHKKPGYENYVLVCFKDETSGKSTYGAGRYIDLIIPEKDEIEVDFNKAYNPYCAYSERYTCPIPPKENTLNIAVEAGVKYENSDAQH